MDYKSITRAELLNICRNNRIVGCSKLKKVDIINILMYNNIKITPDEFDATKCLTNLFDGLAIATRTDKYMPDILKEQYNIHKQYVIKRIETTKNIGVYVRLPAIPEDISENIIKFILHNKTNDTTSMWCKKGDLTSCREGKQECKCFTSDAPISFTPSSNWDIIYFLDARNWLNDKFVLHRVALKWSSDEWKGIKISKTQTFDDQIRVDAPE